jgi:hypothetical protein
MAPTPGPFGPTKSLVQLEDAPAPTGAGSYASHGALHDVLHEDRKFKIQSVAGPDVTDQIGASVHLSAMEGGEPFPGDNRHITGYATPSSFEPQYGVNTVKDAADLADEERAKTAAKNAAVEAEKAKKEAEIQAAREKETQKALADKKAALDASVGKASTVKEKDALIAELNKTVSEEKDLNATLVKKAVDKAEKKEVEGDADAGAKEAPAKEAPAKEAPAKDAEAK